MLLLLALGWRVGVPPTSAHAVGPLARSTVVGPSLASFVRRRPRAAAAACRPAARGAGGTSTSPHGSSSLADACTLARMPAARAPGRGRLHRAAMSR